MKTNKGLVEYAKKALAEKWGYVWGTFGLVLTEVLFQQKLKQYPDGVGKYKDFIAKNWLNRRTTDCVGLIKSYCWDQDGNIKYDTKTDISANGMYNLAKERGPISTIPEIPGICVWKEGHIGVYIGGGQVIEARGTKSGVIQSSLKGIASAGWTHWLKCPYVSYETAQEPTKTKQEMAVDAALASGTITDRNYWLKVLQGKEPINLDYLAQAFLNTNKEVK